MSNEPEIDVTDLLEVFGADFLCPTTTKVRGRPKGRLGPTALAIRAGVEELRSRYDRMTVRQCFYQLETLGVIEKTEGGYRQVQHQLVKMRREGLLPWSFITDGTRWQRKPASYADLSEYVTLMSRSYRRDLWKSQGLRIEIWLEKDALADVVVDMTREWDVPLMVSRGQSSVTFIHSAGESAREAWEQAGAETHVYALYDFDAGGDRAFRTVQQELPEHAGDAPVHVTRLAVTEAQIGQWSLPTRPAKKSDPEAKSWGGKPCVELDAIDPTRLTGLVGSAIVRHVDKHAWAVERQFEQGEREGLRA